MLTRERVIAQNGPQLEVVTPCAVEPVKELSVPALVLCMVAD